jgi:hypothetical protein
MPSAASAATIATATVRYDQPMPREAAFGPAAEAIATPLAQILPPAQIAPPEPAPAPTHASDKAWPAPDAAGPFRPAAPLTPPAPAAAADRAQAGWLSNLLAAASRDEPDAVALRGTETWRGTETLEALTQGISGLIDSAAAVEVWDRWRRGDSAAVSRRLYTEAGQRAFDEIRRRYRNDPQFRETATRYTEEFERLLAKVSQNDREGSQWRAYLLSKTGKVYTLLAHASGRLG